MPRWDYRRRINEISLSFVLLGAAVFFGSFYLWATTSSLAALTGVIGLALVVVGTVLTLLSTHRYVHSYLAGDSALSACLQYQHILEHYDCKGQGIHIPNSTNGGIRVYVPIEENGVKTLQNGGIQHNGGEPLNNNHGVMLPPLEEFHNVKLYVKNGKNGASQDGLLLLPMGLSLLEGFERELDVDFSGVSIEEVPELLQLVMVKKLEIVEGMKVRLGNPSLNVTLHNSIFFDFCTSIRNRCPTICEKVGCPVCSAIALVLCKNTHRCVMIQHVAVDEKKKVQKIKFELLDPPEKMVNHNNHCK